MPRQWNALLLSARRSGLLARLTALLEEHDLFQAAPDKARRQMRAAAIAAASTQTAVRFELNRVLRALQGLDAPLVLMKGSAYVLASLPPARGRFVGDLDIMVAREVIDAVEQRLLERGWTAAELDDYDQRYYREWAHEIPPLQHPERDTPLDIHHTIVPLTSRFRPDAAALLAASVPLADPRLRVLGPADMVLHSCVHLINDEVGMPLRDLFDLHDLMTHFGARPGFWDELLEHARLHGLQRPLYYLLRCAPRLLGTTVPAETMRAAEAAAPGPVVDALMGWIFSRRFAAPESARPRLDVTVASWMYYLRAHWLRMPPGLLVRHLTHKALRGLKERVGRKQADAEA